MSHFKEFLGCSLVFLKELQWSSFRGLKGSSTDSSGFQGDLWQNQNYLKFTIASQYNKDVITKQSHLLTSSL